MRVNRRMTLTDVSVAPAMPVAAGGCLRPPDALASRGLTNNPLPLREEKTNNSLWCVLSFIFRPTMSRERDNQKTESTSDNE
ncbi:hypothetical protein CLV65_0104 [Pseudoscardovia suis]|uniref:Uncharacterized protein n=1 Tax=Pseudoscardovia suis TaxID=987063 RepID=A0A261EYR3_9BIFI|nr:hypothetical protein PSSU_0783 [Pseudoscardovia suis]PJJ69403.1 hypothetical protein CLV65_0104 [Pseudoscardovia suis]